MAKHSQKKKISPEVGQIEIAEAMEQYQEALQLNPNLTDAHYNLGLIFSETGRTSGAIGQFEQALRLKPDDADVRDHLGQTASASANSAGETVSLNPRCG